jgi:hypothetical protein
MPKMTPEQEAAYALNFNVDRSSLSMAGQLEYDRLKTEGQARLAGQLESPSTPAPPARSSPEIRARILQMFKRGNRKYALPFEKDRLAIASFAGGNWEEYGQIILQMAILDTLLSIEEKLSQPDASDLTG